MSEFAAKEVELFIIENSRKKGMAANRTQIAKIFLYYQLPIINHHVNKQPIKWRITYKNVNWSSIYELPKNMFNISNAIIPR